MSEVRREKGGSPRASLSLWVWGPAGLVARGLALGALVLFASGCALVGMASAPERERRREVLADQAFTVETIPPGAPSHRAASFRLAAEGYRALRAGRWGEAEDRLERALSLDPQNPFCYLYLAEIRYREGDARQAIVLLRQGEVFFQGHPYWLGEVYAREGSCWEALRAWDEAEAAYRKALEHNPWNEEAGGKAR